jgi:hypothetical protein
MDFAVGICDGVGVPAISLEITAMKWKNGNIWIWHRMGSTIVIPTNAGWKNTSEGPVNVMGAGLAKDAAERTKEFPGLAARYGAACATDMPCFWMPEWHLIMVPTKKLIPEKPWLSWKAPASIERVTESLVWLQKLVDQEHASFERGVYVPLLGAGNGKLNEELIQELMDKILVHPLFIGVTWIGDLSGVRMGS